MGRLTAKSALLHARSNSDSNTAMSVWRFKDSSLSKSRRACNELEVSLSVLQGTSFLKITTRRQLEQPAYEPDTTDGRHEYDSIGTMDGLAARTEGQ